MLRKDHQEIMDYLAVHKYITPLDYLYKFGHMRLSARIKEMRKELIDIKTEIIYEGKNHYARYSLETSVFKVESNGQLSLV